MRKAAVQRLGVRSVARLFKALGDEQRVRIVALLTHGELCVCHIEGALELNQPNASRLLAVLKNGGVVEARRAGHWVYYRLAPQADAFCRSQLEALTAAFSKQADLRADMERLLKSRGPGACS